MGLEIVEGNKTRKERRKKAEKDKKQGPLMTLLYH